MTPDAKDCALVTAGNSLLLNLKSLAGNPAARAAGWNENALERRNAIAAARLLDTIDPRARECGAEINSVTSLQDKGYLVSMPHLHLFVSDTTDGEFVGQVLRSYYAHKVASVAPKTVIGLKDEDFRSFKNQGLRNLVRDLADAVRDEQRHGRSPLINATGGFKAQISFAGLIGQVLAVPVFYMFERFAEVIEMPPMPVAFDFSLWLEHFTLLDTLRGRDLKDTDPALQGIDPRLEPLLLRLDGDVTLSAMGELFHQGFLDQFHQRRSAALPVDSTADPAAKVRVQQGHHRPGGLDAFLKRVAAVSYVTRVETYANAQPRKNGFRPSLRIPACIEGSFSDNDLACEFNVFVHESSAPQQVAAACVDLTHRFVN